GPEPEGREVCRAVLGAPGHAQSPLDRPVLIRDGRGPTPAYPLVRHSDQLATVTVRSVVDRRRRHPPLCRLAEGDQGEEGYPYGDREDVEEEQQDGNERAPTPSGLLDPA